MRLRVTRKIVGGLALAAVFALTGADALARQAGATQQGQQPGADAPGAGRGWGRKGGRLGRRGGPRGDFAGPFGRLNLSDAQREQMRQIAERYRETFRAQRERGPAGRGGGGFDPLAGGAFDEAAVRAAAQARANAQVEHEVARARMMHEMYGVLTAEQKAQLQAFRQEREQRRQELRSRRGAGQGPTQQQ